MVAILSILFVMQGMQAAQDVGDLNQRWSDHWERTSSSLVKISDVLPKTEALSTRPSLKPADGQIDIVELQFSYTAAGTGKRVFDRLNLRIPSGTHFAVIGENGAGKSTLVNLLMRFDDPQAGKLILGGCDIQELSAEALYRSVAYVPQDPKLFNETISRNIMFFEPTASAERVSAAYDATMLRNLLDDRPSGGESPVGEEGQQLSGGERQRVAIARALLREAHVYVFDEATSQLKSDDAEAIVAAVKRLLSGKTFMFVTHSPELKELFPYVLEISPEGAEWIGRSPTLVLPLLPDLGR
jgi:ABC-type multidrug transport system fused ATPase/permease subunit